MITAKCLKPAVDALLRSDRTVEFEFSLRQKVTIVALKLPGIVTAFMVDGDGPTYRVAYWWDGVRRSEWLFAEELEAAP